jgi:nitroimidazol reductase NimA-like FMN-containing flavoprotein (pyridoxamine 5'-phosphate oxidase superfamily)
MSQFPVTDKTSITRLPKRGVYEKDAVYAILDEALVCTIAWAQEGQPYQIPTGFCRIGDRVYIHGSVGSHYMRELAAKKYPVCISVTHLDALVLARSAFHHSVNYRSVIIFSEPEQVTDPATLYNILEVFTEKMCPGRWADVRKPTDNELKGTMVLGFRISEASAKVRTGPPKDDAEDYAMDVWAGVQPFKVVRGPLEPDPDLKPGVPVPGYLKGDE